MGVGRRLHGAQRVLLILVLLLAGCGIDVGVGGNRIQARLEPSPDGPVVEPVRGEAAGEAWAFGVYRSGMQVCVYTATAEATAGAACGPPPGNRGFGPFGVGGDLAGGWTSVGGVVGARVARVDVTLGGGDVVSVPTTPVDDVGWDAAAFFLPLEPGVVANRVVALDAGGREVERVDLAPVEVPRAP